MDEIRPALTPEEWKALRWRANKEVGGGPETAMDEVGCDVQRDSTNYLDFEWSDLKCDPRELRHALAALALHGQPFGFTRQDVQMLLARAGDVEAEERDLSPLSPIASEVAPAYRNLAARIAALLPPEGSR
jgi:hypothetical protein